ncbi:MAG: 16S rRNA (cytidine(1402)-2'-O)-methyltransferase [Patescibacteria group bacterium]
MAVLYIVATPIGNLQDITFRAVETLKRVDLILCEDTRVTQKLLSHYEIKTPTLSYHQHSKLNKIEYILDLLKQGKNLALVSDAGTPGISDPGNKLIAEFTQVQPVPGPSALTAVASIAGFPMDRFLFLGFPPIKNKRKKFFEEVATSRYPVIFYESPYRIIKTLNEIEPLRDIVVGRELTKKFETVYRGKAKDVLNQLTKEEIRGEFVVIINR